MSESAGRVVGWQRRVFDAEEGWGGWMDSDKYAAELFSDPHYAGKVEMRALVPEQLLVDLETKVRALADRIERVGVLASAEKTAAALRALTEKSEETR